MQVREGEGGVGEEGVEGMGVRGRGVFWVWVGWLVVVGGGEWGVWCWGLVMEA